MLAVKAPVLCVPPVANAPDQPPKAVQEVAPVELHVSVDAAPLATEVGLTLKVAVGAAGNVAETATVAVDAGLVPPGPVQVNEYELLAVRAPVV